MTTNMRPKPKPTRWVWTNYIPQGEITTVYGEGGVGKTSACISVALSIAEGLLMPDGSEPGVVGKVLIISQEHTSDQITGKVMAALGGDLSANVIAYGNDLDPVMLPSDIAVLKTIIESEDIKFIVLDPLSMLSNANLNRMDQVRRLIFTPLSKLMADTGCTCVIIHHVNKGNIEVSDQNKAAGSKAIIDASRAAYMVTKNVRAGSQSAAFVWLTVKSNHAKEADSLQFDIAEYEPLKVGFVQWLGTSAIKKRDLETRYGPHGQVVRQATELIRELLNDGPIPSADLLAAAKDRGISIPTLNRARSNVGVEAVRIDGKHYVQLEQVTPEPINNVAKTAEPKRRMMKRKVQ